MQRSGWRKVGRLAKFVILGFLGLVVLTRAESEEAPEEKEGRFLQVDEPRLVAEAILSLVESSRR